MKPFEFCALGEFIVRPHKWKLPLELPFMLKRIQRDICGPINPPYGPFRYFFALIDVSTKWSHVSLLASRNLAFPKLLVQIIQLQARLSNHLIQSIRLDGVGEFKSQAFKTFESVEIHLEYSLLYVHETNSLA
jgi:hypothetical protein